MLKESCNEEIVPKGLTGIFHIWGERGDPGGQRKRLKNEDIIPFYRHWKRGVNHSLTSSKHAAPKIHLESLRH